MAEEITQIRAQMSSMQTTPDAPNIEIIQKTAYEEKLNEVRKQHDMEKQMIERDLEVREDKVIRLQIELDEQKEKYQTLETTMQPSDLAQKKK